MGKVDERLKELGIELPKKDLKGKGLVPFRLDGNLLYCSGQGPIKDGVSLYQGKLGSDYTVEEGYTAARECGIILLGKLQEYLGDLDRIEAVIKVLGFVASDVNFYQQPKVIHGFSDLMTDVFGEQGVHARSAVGVSVLPNNWPVEVEMIVRIKD